MTSRGGDVRPIWEAEARTSPGRASPTTGVEIFAEADCETHATVADLLSPAVVSWRKILSFSILA